MFAVACLVLLAGYPVAFTLAGVALVFGVIGAAAGVFGFAELLALPSRVFGIVGNETLIAVPLFIAMGVMLERSKIADALLNSVGELFGPLRGGLAIAVVLVGALLAAATGIVGATVVTMGLLSLPTMLRRGYDPALTSGTICAAGTLGQVIPPSIVLVLLGDVLSTAYQRAQASQGIFRMQTVSVGDLFIGALIPGLMLVALYIAYIAVVAWRYPALAPALPRGGKTHWGQLVLGLVPPLVLIVAVLGSIIAGVATPTEAAAVGALGAGIMAALRGRAGLAELRDVVQRTARITSMVFMILIGATMFSLVFSTYGGDTLVREALADLPGGVFAAMFIVMAVMFLLGFILDFIEITFVVVPIVAPVLLAMGLDPVWLGIMMAVNLQTSFLTPPFGFALFYLRGVAPPEISTGAIYRGVVPFIGIQVLMLIVLSLWPGLATWLPEALGT